MVRIGTAVIIVCLTLSMVFTGCGGAKNQVPGISYSPVDTSIINTISMTPQTNTSDTAELSGSITESGSTTVQPLAQELADAFHAKYPKVNIVIQGGGTAVGIKAAQDGTTDIGAASRDLTDEEKTTVVSFVLARDAVVAVVLT